MSLAFTHDEVFLAVDRLIRTLHKKRTDYVTHRVLADALLADAEGKKLVLAAAKTGNKWTRREWASNMVAWFSKRFTEGLPDLVEHFDRVKLFGKWAYKPAGQRSLSETASPFTMFSFGTWGWGNATKELIKAVDAVEAGRGFEPPVFVDVRIQRTGRAEGFKGTNFAELLDGRHHWVKALGNRKVKDREVGMKIDNPWAADDLLNIALRAACENRRVIFFCACPLPRENGKVTCHRTEVARLLLKMATHHGVPLTVVEWPGGEPEPRALDVRPSVFADLDKDTKRVPLTRQQALAWAGLPWRSPVTIQSGGNRAVALADPARYNSGTWYLPIARLRPADDAAAAKVDREAVADRRLMGLNPTSSSK